MVDTWKSVAEVGLDGKLIAAHPLKLEQSELVSNLRSATAADGKRYFAAFASAQQRFHLLDGSWNPLASYPEDALTNSHAGIADVQLGDLDGDGMPEAVRRLLGRGRRAGRFAQGKRLWSNRSVSNVGRMAIGEPDAQGKRNLFCTNNTGSLAVIDAAGRADRRGRLPGQLLHFIAAADLNGDGKLLWCGLAAPQLGSNVAVGLDLTGKDFWRYPLPVGVHRQPIEPVVAGRLSSRGAGQWLLPGRRRLDPHPVRRRHAAGPFQLRGPARRPGHRRSRRPTGVDRLLDRRIAGVEGGMTKRGHSTLLKIAEIRAEATIYAD